MFMYIIDTYTMFIYIIDVYIMPNWFLNFDEIMFFHLTEY